MAQGSWVVDILVKRWRWLGEFQKFFYMKLQSAFIILANITLRVLGFLVLERN